MSASDPHLFNDAVMRFSLRKPAHWDFMPPAWSPVAQLKNASGPEDWIQYARLPFCCASARHDSPVHVYPTLQATVRPSGVPGNEQAAEILARQLAFLSAEHLDFDAFEATSEAVVAGCRANVIKACFTLPFEREGELVMAPVISRSWLLFAPGRAFTVGLSTSGDPGYYDERDIEQVVASIWVGA